MRIRGAVSQCRAVHVDATVSRAHRRCTHRPVLDAVAHDPTAATLRPNGDLVAPAIRNAVF